MMWNYQRNFQNQRYEQLFSVLSNFEFFSSKHVHGHFTSM